MSRFRLDQIEWDGQNIVVMNKVTIVPPYGPDNIRGQTDGRAANHVRKIVSALTWPYLYGRVFKTNVQFPD